MDADDPDLQVRPDDYRAASADVVLSARLHSSLAVCLYDETESEGALLHLRLAAPGGVGTKFRLLRIEGALPQRELPLGR